MIGQVVPDDAAEFVLKVARGPASSGLAFSFALGTFALDREAGQEGIGEAHQMQVGNCGVIRAVLVLPQPQKLLAVFKEDLDTPAIIIDNDHLTGGQGRVIGGQTQTLSLSFFPGEDHMQTAQVTDVDPSGVDIGVVDRTFALAYLQCFLSAAEQTWPIPAGLELSAVLEQVAVALERRDKPEPLFSTRLDHHRAQIVAVEQDSHANPFKNVELTDGFCRQLRGLFEGDLKAAAIFPLHVQPHAEGDGVPSKPDRGLDMLVPEDTTPRHRIMDPVDRVHGSAPLGLLRVVDNQFDHVPFPGLEGRKQFVGFLPQCRLRIPPRHVHKVVEPTAIGLVPNAQMVVEDREMFRRPHAKAVSSTRVWKYSK